LAGDVDPELGPDEKKSEEVTAVVIVGDNETDDATDDQTIKEDSDGEKVEGEEKKSALTNCRFTTVSSQIFAKLKFRRSF